MAIAGLCMSKPAASRPTAAPFALALAFAATCTKESTARAELAVRSRPPCTSAGIAVLLTEMDWSASSAAWVAARSDCRSLLRSSNSCWNFCRSAASCCRNCCASARSAWAWSMVAVHSCTVAFASASTCSFSARSCSMRVSSPSFADRVSSYCRRASFSRAMDEVFVSSSWPRSSLSMFMTFVPPLWVEYVAYCEPSFASQSGFAPCRNSVAPRGKAAAAWSTLPPRICSAVRPLHRALHERDVLRRRGVVARQHLVGLGDGADGGEEVRELLLVLLLLGLAHVRELLQGRLRGQDVLPERLQVRLGLGDLVALRVEQRGGGGEHVFLLVHERVLVLLLLVRELRVGLPIRAVLVKVRRELLQHGLQQRYHLVEAALRRDGHLCCRGRAEVRRR